MKYIYRIQHRDLKPENILMYKPNWFGVSDFGTSRIKFESLHSLRGATLRYNKKGLFDSNIVRGTLRFKSPEFMRAYLEL
jgi:serine/threonine protein kinase